MNISYPIHFTIFTYFFDSFYEIWEKLKHFEKLLDDDKKHFESIGFKNNFGSYYMLKIVVMDIKINMKPIHFRFTQHPIRIR